ASEKATRGGKFSQWVSKQAAEDQVPSVSRPSPAPIAPAFDELVPEKVMDVKQPSNDDDEAFRQYMEKFGENRDGTNAGFNRKAFPWFTPKEPAKVPSVSTEVLEAAMDFKPKPRISNAKLSEVDSE
ncbi:unnamed protein product, partial [Symbiodinium pilosum]